MSSRAVNYSRRIAAAVRRLGGPVTLSRGGAVVQIAPILLPGTTVIVPTASSATPTRQLTTQQNSYALTSSAQPAASTSASSSTSAIPTLTMVQDAAQSSPAVGDTFAFDGSTWTVQTVGHEYINNVVAAIITVCTAPAIS